MTKFFYAAALTAAFVLLAVDVQRSGLQAETAGFKVGIILPLTGPAAEYGQSIQNALELAKIDHPELFKNVEFRVEDVGYDTKRAVSAFQKLVDIDRVDLIYTFGVSFCQALAPLAEARRKPLVGQCVGESSSAGRRYVMRFMNSSEQYMEKLAVYLKQQGFRKPTVIVSDNSYLDLMLDSFSRHWGEGLDIERVPSGEMDLRPFISRLKTRQPEVVGVFLSTGQIAQFYRQRREMSLISPTFGTNFFESVAETKAAQGAMDGAIFVNNVVKDSFHRRYLQTFGNESHLAFAGPSYEFALALGSTVAQSSQLNDDDIIKKLSALEPRGGDAAGPYEGRFSESAGHYVNFPLGVKRIRGSSFEVIDGGQG